MTDGIQNVERVCYTVLMLAIALILLFLVYLVLFSPRLHHATEPEAPKIRDSVQMKKLWALAQVSMKNHHTLRAEKALLTILRFDEKNASAYNRLGILYAKEKKWDDAIECFEIAQSLDNNASSLHNVGLVYLETENYDKAAQAFQQAITLEGDLPTRYIAYSKAEEKLGNRAKALEALETAYTLDPSTTVLRHILELHERADDIAAITETKERIATLLEAKKTKPPRVRQRTLRPVRPSTPAKPPKPPRPPRPRGPFKRKVI